jgi:GNAT superfamily N-acetyltransferase
MEIRILTADDVESYLAIWRRALTDHPSAFGASVNDADMFDAEAARIRLAKSMPYNPIFGVFVDGQQVGLASLFYPAHREKTRHRVHVHQVYVAPEQRGRGIATALMREIITFARMIPDVEEVHLAVTVGNETARRVYVNCGFVAHNVDARIFKIDGAYYDLEYMNLRLYAPKDLAHL